MDFEFTEEEKMFRESLRDLLEREFAPIVNERDRQGPFTREEAIEVMQKFKKIGIGLDPEGSRELIGNPVIFAIFCEVVSGVWPSILPLFGMGSIPAMFIPLASDEVKSRLIPRLESGEFIGCFAESEPEAGCDTANIKTTAVLDGDHYVINGSKTWISNATIADTAFVAAKDAKTGAETFFIVEKDISPWETNELHKIG